MYEAIIPENIPVGSFVTRVGASDADESGTPNARIDYSLSGPHSNMFVMHRKTGKFCFRIFLQVPGISVSELSKFVVVIRVYHKRRSILS